MKNLLTLLFISISAACLAQAPKEKEPKILYDTITLESVTVKKLQSIEESYKNLGDPKWIEQQKSILALQHQIILETTTEANRKEFSQGSRYENGKILVPRKQETKHFGEF